MQKSRKPVRCRILHLSIFVGDYIAAEIGQISVTLTWWNVKRCWQAHVMKFLDDKYCWMKWWYVSSSKVYCYKISWKTSWSPIIFIFIDVCSFATYLCLYMFFRVSLYILGTRLITFFVLSFNAEKLIKNWGPSGQTVKRNSSEQQRLITR